VLKALRDTNPHIYAVTGRPRRPSDQGSVESMNKLVKRILGTLLTESRLAGDDPNWTKVLGMVAATINSQHGRGKGDVSSFEAVYGQKVLNHVMSCSKAKARQCWILPQFLKVSNNAEFAEYAANNYNLDEDSSDDAKQDDSGYFSDEELQEDEKEEVTDDDFFNLLNENILENDTDRNRPPEEEHLNVEEHNDFADMEGFVNEDTLFDVEVDVHIEELQRKTAESLPFAAGHWQGDEAQDGDADGDHYQTLEVDEDHDNFLTPEKKQFMSYEVDYPDVISLMQFIINQPPPQQTVDDEDDEEQAVDVWDELWVMG
jgi:hypothetical protein